MSTTLRNRPHDGTRVSRRTVLKGAAGVGVVGAVCPFTGATAAAAETTETLTGAQALATKHTRMQRGLDIAAAVSRSASAS